ncbi:hypothetical protein PWT90_00338 [Aphanocladium album]|nr:hypothetical protein PWT90_00338 [Aphanocladium album]
MSTPDTLRSRNDNFIRSASQLHLCLQHAHQRLRAWRLHQRPMLGDVPARAGAGAGQHPGVVRHGGRAAKLVDMGSAERKFSECALPEQHPRAYNKRGTHSIDTETDNVFGGVDYGYDPDFYHHIVGRVVNHDYTVDAKQHQLVDRFQLQHGDRVARYGIKLHHKADLSANFIRANDQHDGRAAYKGQQQLVSHEDGETHARP